MDDPRARDRLTRLWLEHRSAVAGFAMRRLPADAIDDVVSETFLVAWRRLEEVPAEARGWLLAVARNVIATQTRTHGRWKALAVKIALEPAPTRTAVEDDAIESIRLRQAWQRLSHAEREVLALAVWDGLTGDQAAQVLGCRRSTYSVRLSRARKHFLDLLREGTDPNPDPEPVTALHPQRSTR